MSLSSLGNALLRGRSPLVARLARGMTWSVTGTALSRLLALAVSVVSARILGKAQFGALGVVISTIGMFQALAGFGAGATATKHVAELRATDPMRASRILTLSSQLSMVTGLLSAGALALGATWLATRTLNAPDLASPLRIAAIGLFFSALLGADSGALAGLEAFRALAFATLYSGLLALPLSIVCVVLGGLKGAVWAQSVTVVLQWLVTRIALKKRVRELKLSLQQPGWTEELSLVWSFALPTLAAGLMVPPVNWLCGAFLVNQVGGYKEMGVFNAANQWYSAVLLVPSAAGAALLPVLAERIGSCDYQTARKILRTAIVLNAGIVLVPIVILGSASKLIMGLYGSEFTAGANTMMVMIVTAGVSAVLAPTGLVLIAMNRAWTGFLLNLAWAVIFVVASLLLVRTGAIGLASARLIAYVTLSIWTAVVAAQLLSNSLKSTRKPRLAPDTR